MAPTQLGRCTPFNLEIAQNPHSDVLHSIHPDSTARAPPIFSWPTDRGPTSARSAAVQFKMLTARDTTRATVRSEAIDCSVINCLAAVERGMVSVGLKAVALVNEVYR